MDLENGRGWRSILGQGRVWVDTGRDGRRIVLG